MVTIARWSITTGRWAASSKFEHCASNDAASDPSEQLVHQLAART
jgi:hypothetical protein